MTTKTTSVNIADTASTEFHNIVSGPRGLETRAGFVTVRTLSDLGQAVPAGGTGVGVKIIYAFSVESANSAEVFHYVFWIDGNTNICQQSIYDEQMFCLAQTEIGKLGNSQTPFSVAVNYNQIVVNSPDLQYPLWGFIGGSLVRAESVPSINPDTTALTLYPGRVAAFADRFAWAYKNQVIFNDPGTEPRTITAPQSISLGGTVLDMFQAGTGGNFIIVCTDATYSIPPDALNGFQFNGTIAKIPGYQGAQPNNAATARGTSVGLSREGIVQLNGFASKKLTNYRQRRRLTKPVGPMGSGDYRSGSIIATDDQLLISIGTATCIMDLDSGFNTWYYPGADWFAQGGNTFNVIGVLRDGQGKNIYVTPTAIIEPLGNVDYAQTPTVAAPTPVATTPEGAVCFTWETSPNLSPVVRELTSGADRPGFLQKTAMLDSSTVATTPTPRDGIVIGTSVWGTSTTYVEREMRSRRHQRAIRTDSPDFEIGFTGGAVKIDNNCTIETKGWGTRRPTN